MGDRRSFATAMAVALSLIAGYLLCDLQPEDAPHRWVIAEDVESVNPAGKMLRCTFAASLGDEPRLYITECHDP